MRRKIDLMYLACVNKFNRVKEDVTEKVNEKIQGATTLEYFLLAALIIVFLVAVWALVSKKLDSKVGDLQTNLDKAAPTPTAN